MVTTPRKVSRGTAAAVSASVDYQVSTVAQVGGIAIGALQSGIHTQHFITVGSGAGTIAGSTEVPVTERAGRRIAWSLDYFGQSYSDGGFTIADTCVPIEPVPLPTSRVIG
jgi:hypothetical protein